MTSLRAGPLGGGVANSFPSTNQSAAMQMSRSGVKAVESDRERRAEATRAHRDPYVLSAPSEKLRMAD